MILKKKQIGLVDQSNNDFNEEVTFSLEGIPEGATINLSLIHI